MADSSSQRLAKRSAHGFAYIAFWQFMGFLILVLLVWVNEVMDLSALLFATPPMEPDIFRGCILTAGVLVAAIVVVGHTYVQQQLVIRGILTVCSYCSKVRFDHEAWEKIEEYVARHSELTFSHGVCPDCFEKHTKSIREPRTGNTPAT